MGPGLPVRKGRPTLRLDKRPFPGISWHSYQMKELRTYRTDTNINTSATINFTEVNHKELGLRRKGQAHNF